MTGMTERARAAGKDSMGRREMEQKRGPRDVDNVSWAIGMFYFFLFSFIFLFTNKDL